jgi:Transposase domain (DUF772)
MAGFVEGIDRGQSTLFPALLDDYVAEDNPVRAVDVFVDGLDLDKLGFVGVQPLDTGRPGYHPGTMLKLYIYGYLNRVPSSRRLERECQRNIEMIWLTGYGLGLRASIAFELGPDPANDVSGRSSSSANQTMSFFFVSRLGSGAYSAKLLNGTRQRFSGFSNRASAGRSCCECW